MDKKSLRKYLSVGLTIVIVVTICLLIFFLLFNIQSVGRAVLNLFDIVMPFIVGAVIAYLLAPIYNFLCRNLDYFFSSRMKPRRARSLARGLSVTLSILVFIGIVCGLAAMVIPQLIESAVGLAEALPGYLTQLGEWLADFFQSDNVQTAYNDLTASLLDWLSNDLLPGLENISSQLGAESGVQTVVNSLFSGVKTVINVVKNIFVGLVVSVYLLLGKEKFVAHAKKLLYAVAGAEKGNGIMLRIRYINKVFGGFIQGKLLDSLIIGIICFVGCSLLRMPYTLLVSAVVGVTNVIPIFGPIIGGVLCGLLILLADPVKCVYFIIFVLALQQFDGHILGPKILGSTTGLSAFSVLFAILFFGGLFGFVGMIIGVPLFAVISSLVGEAINGQLSKKALSMDVEDYRNLDYVDGREHRYVKRKDPSQK